MHCAWSQWHGVCVCMCIYTVGVLGTPDGFFSGVCVDEV